MIEVLKDNLIIEPLKHDTVEIILPERAQNAPKFGTVRFVGPDVQALKPGDTVILPTWNDDELEVDGKKYVVLAEKAISVRVI